MHAPKSIPLTWAVKSMNWNDVDLRWKWENSAWNTWHVIGTESTNSWREQNRCIRKKKQRKKRENLLREHEEATEKYCFRLRSIRLAKYWLMGFVRRYSQRFCQWPACNYTKTNNLITLPHCHSLHEHIRYGFFARSVNFYLHYNSMDLAIIWEPIWLLPGAHHWHYFKLCCRRYCELFTMIIILVCAVAYFYQKSDFIRTSPRVLIRNVFWLAEIRFRSWEKSYIFLC